VTPSESQAQPEQRASVLFARREGHPPAIFKSHEKFDVSDPESFARIEDALADDEQANALITAVLSETGKSSLRELVTFINPRNAFENGVSTITTDRASPMSVLAGWPALDSEGLFMPDPNPGTRLSVVVSLNPRSEMIELYATIIHELTHVLGSLRRMKSENLNELLIFKDANDYSLWNIERQGGEVDAFAAEISAVIRYRNRYNLPYEPFHTASSRENFRIFNLQTGELLNRRALEDSIAGKGNKLAYYSTGIDKFTQMIRLELSYCETLLQQLKTSRSYDQRADVREEARRLENRVQRIRAQYPSIVN
jgi:hypothetical protein